MKKIFIIFICFFSLWVHQSDAMQLVACRAVAAGGASCDSCAGGLVVSWQVEGTDTSDALNTTSGVAPDCGCTVSGGDTSFTVANGAVIASAPTGKTGYALHVTSGSDIANLSISSKDIFDSTQGTITFDLYISTWADAAYLFRTKQSANVNELRLYLYDLDGIRALYYGNSAAVAVQINNASLTTSTWYSVIFKWDTAAGDPNLYIEVNGYSSTSNTDLTDFTSQPTIIDAGNDSGVTVDYYIKNLKIYTTWE